MKYATSERGFRFILHDTHANELKEERLVSESSAVNLDAHLAPGGDYLWIGERFHLDHEQVTALRDALAHWLENGRLPTGDAER